MFHQLKPTFVLVLFMRLWLESHAAPDICSICSCENSQTYVYCSSRGLTSVPQAMPLNVEYLDLRFNNIKAMKNGTFQNLSNLTSLYLQDNDINEIETGAFQNLSSLTTLSLWENNITEIKAETFQNLPSLTNLNLGRNNMKEINEETFRYLSNLRTLDLTYNNIEKIKEETFRYLSNLRSLDLSFNKIKEIKKESFRHLSTLTKLYFQKNDINEIEVGTFQNLPSLMELSPTAFAGYMSQEGIRSLITKLWTILNFWKNNITEIDVGTFQHLSNLTALNLWGNKIKEINVGSFQNLSSLRTLYLSSNDIKEIKSNTFRNLSSLTELGLSSNDIKEIKADTFGNLSSLTDLELQHNNIGNIEERAFHDLTSLRNLNFWENNITEIKVGTFQHLSSLTTLNLWDNKIKEIKVGTFQNLSSLTTLYLSENDIKEIKTYTFRNMSSLKDLVLQNNNIGNIEERAFDDLPSLKNLYLEKNNITNIEVKAFHDLPSLKKLDLTENKIKKIQEGNFNGLPSLTYLYLTYNDIKEIAAGSFRNLSNLKELNLGANDIKEIKSETFQNLFSLTKLFLGENDIEEIKSDTFRNLSSLQELYLQSNNITNIEVRAFHDLHSLKKLFLSHNYITEIKAESFKNLSALTYLHLEYNDIKGMEVGSFQNLHSLLLLYLGGNALKEIKAGSIQNLPRLTHLYLNENKIEKVTAGAFDDLPSLRFLYLNANDIQKIEVRSFNDLPSLRYLYLPGNNINEIKPGTFQDLSSLTTLDLSGNDIVEINAGIFRNLSSLNYLKLANNDIKETESGMFRPLFSLTSLDLNRNYIKGIKAETFQNLSSLRTLSLRNNRIQNFEDGVFLFLPSINYIDLGGNNDMMCGCYLPALVNYTNGILKRNLYIWGMCQKDLGNNQSKVIPILEYSQCQNSSLFQRNLQCQTCSRMTCSASEVTSCPEEEPVCRLKLSMKGVTLNLEKSCSTYRKCFEALKNNTFTCNKWTSGTSCVACCTGNLCNKNDFIGWSNSFVFHLIFNSTLKKFNEYKTHTENISRAMELELSNLTGIFEVDYCGSEKNSEVFTITCTVLSTITKDHIFKQVFDTFKASQTLPDLGLQQRNMELIDEMVCNEITTATSNGTFHWPMTKIGNNVTIPCHANVATRYCSSRRSEMPPKCSPFTGVWKEPDMTQCYNTERITQQLKNITNEDIDKENVGEISTIVRDISKKSEYFKAEDIDLAVDIHEKMVPLISNVSANITVNNILPSINNMINTPEEVLIEAEQSEGTGSRMLDIIEAIPEKMPLEEQQLTVLYTNLGIGVIKVKNNTFNGAVYGISFGNKENDAKTMIYNNSDSKPEVNDMVDFISLATSLLKDLKPEERAAVSRITFISMQNDKLYRTIQKSNTKTNTKINSNIIAATIPNIKITNLDDPVNISFNLIEQNLFNPQCVYWDESPGQDPHWSTKGCNTSMYVPGEKMFCSCNHLTSFAILMDVYQETSHLLYITSYIGCGISLVCLILTVIIHVCSKNLRKLMASKILVNLCVSLAITNFIFLVAMHPYALKVSAACKTVAALLHYFLLASLMWTAVEALHIFVHMASFMMKSSILAWGLPAVIVAITLAINKTNNYIKIADVCWLSKTPFYAAFLAPLVVILIFNFTMISLVIWRLRSMESKKLFEHETKKMRVFGIFSLTFLLVLSWVLAFIAVEEQAEVFHILFIIFNILLGMFIFIFYCICKEDARDAICSCVSKQKKGNTKVTSQNL